MMWWDDLPFHVRDFVEMLSAFFALALVITLVGMFQQSRKQRRRK